MSKQKENTVYVPIVSIESEHGASIINRTLSQIEGLDYHAVELNNLRAVLKFKEAEVLQKAVYAIRKMGYEVVSVKKNYPVLGLN
ncbi:MAG: heavy-metal-associated domain-containing protein, partial [Bacteroidales bacterium]|nr:heavy-metal-associated domain-containing protein [Bacteroidales bacterium]